MSSTLFERTAKVLFFATLDEAFAIRCANEIVENTRDVSEALKQISGALKKSHSKNHKVQPIKGHFDFPPGVDISHWREFRLNASAEEFEAVLFKWIGRFSDEEVIQVSRVSEGTLKSRCNSGLRNLGALLIKEHA